MSGAHWGCAVASASQDHLVSSSIFFSCVKFPVAFTNSLSLGCCWSGFYLKQMITDPDCSEICELGCVLHDARGLSIHHAFYGSGTPLSTNLGERIG